MKWAGYNRQYSMRSDSMVRKIRRVLSYRTVLSINVIKVYKVITL